MGADASVFSQLRQQAVQPGPLDQYAQMMSVKQLMGGNELQDLQRQKLTRDLQEEDATKQLFANSGDMSAADMYKKLLGISPTRAMAFQKSDLETQGARANLEKTQTETLGAKAKQGRDLIASMTPENYAETVAQGAALKQQWAATAPAQFDPQWQRQHVMDADKFITQNTPKFEKVDIGGKIEMVDVNPFTNPAIKGTALEKTVTPDAKLTDERTRSEGKLNRGNSFAIAQMTDTRDRQIAGIGADGLPTGDIKEIAKLIADGHMPPLGAMALSRPRGQQIMSEVAKINPEYDAGQVQASFKAAKDFATGKQGNSVRSFNVSLSHLDTLANAGEALKNGNMQIFNRIGNEYAAQTGQVAPTDFESVKKIVGDEIVKAIVGNGGGVADREEVAKTLAKANSPAQLTGVINRYKELMRGQLAGLRQQYEVSTGRKDFDKFLSDSAKKQAHGADAPSTSTVTPSQTDIDAELRRRGVIR